MESSNPFIQRITANREQLENYDEIGSADLQPYFLRGQTHKFLQPGSFSFMHLPVDFIAFDIDDDHNIKSMLLYLDEYETVLESLEDEFGISDLSFNLDGDAEHSGSTTEKLTFKSYTWIREKFRMTFSLYPVKDSKGQISGIKSQIYILQ